MFPWFWFVFHMIQQLKATKMQGCILSRYLFKEGECKKGGSSGTMYMELQLFQQLPFSVESKSLIVTKLSFWQFVFLSLYRYIHSLSIWLSIYLSYRVVSIYLSIYPALYPIYYYLSIHFLGSLQAIYKLKI